MIPDESLDSLTERALAAIFEVSNTLGAGFLEKVYERALLRELALRNIPAIAQASFGVCYKGQSVGEYLADILVEDVLVAELKCVDRLANEHTAQCITIFEPLAERPASWSIFRSQRSNGNESCWATPTTIPDRRSSAFIGGPSPAADQRR